MLLNLHIKTTCIRTTFCWSLRWSIYKSFTILAYLIVRTFSGDFGYFWDTLTTNVLKYTMPWKTIPWSLNVLKAGSITLKCRTFCQECLVFHHRWSLMAVASQERFHCSMCSMYSSYIQCHCSWYCSHCTCRLLWCYSNYVWSELISKRSECCY